jgi:hypothetical protein
MQHPDLATGNGTKLINTARRGRKQYDEQEKNPAEAK